jgi:hypothetical protein
MSDNARFHNKLHRKNHHTRSTDGYFDSASDPIASQAEPFQGDFYLEGNLNIIGGAINTSYVTLSNINIPVPLLSANVGFQPTNSLIVQLSGIKYAIPVTLVGSNTFTSSSSGINSLSAGITYLGNTFITGTLSGNDSNNWNDTRTTLLSNSGSWRNGLISFTTLTANSGLWTSTYTTVCAASAAWQSATITDTWVRANSATIDIGYTSSVYPKLSSQVFTFQSTTSSIVTLPANLNNVTFGNFSGILGGRSNTASAYGNSSTIVGGSANCVNGPYSVIAGGNTNTISSSSSFIGGGNNNCIQGDYSGIIGGRNNSSCLGTSCSFIIGANIVADQPNTAYVNNLNSQCLVAAGSACVGFLDVRPPGITGITLPNTRAQVFSNVNSYAQINHQNLFTGLTSSSASSDFIATADNGNDTNYFVDLGINGSCYNVPSFGITGPNDAYLYTQGCNLTIGTAGAGNVLLHTGGTLASNERMRITASGYVGIGTTNPISPVTISSALTAVDSAPTLTVFGNVSATGCVYSNNFIPSVYTCLNTGISPTSGSNVASGEYTIVAGGNGNTASGYYASILGGRSNTASGSGANINGGRCNTSSGSYATIVGGLSSTASGNYSSIGGGYCLNAIGYSSTISGGYKNIASGNYSVVAGGRDNTASCAYSIIVGGYNNVNAGVNSFIAGGVNNTINSNVTGAFVLGSNMNIFDSNQTYVNGLVADNSICAASINITNGICSNSICTTSLTGFYGDFYQTTVWDSTNIRDSAIGRNLTVSGKATLSGNKYTSLIGNGVLSSFTVNHKLSTSDVVMTVSNVSAKQVVYPSIVITDESNVQVSFTSVPPITSYKISIIGL